MKASERKVSPLGARIIRALEETGRTQTSVETALVEKSAMTKGSLSSLITGRRGTKSVSIEALSALADELRVEFDWLARERGPMRKSDRGASPIEAAVLFATREGIPPDAIRSALEWNAGREAEMSALDWVLAFEWERRRASSSPSKSTPPTGEAVAALVRRTKSRLEQAPQTGGHNDTKHSSSSRRRIGRL